MFFSERSPEKVLQGQWQYFQQTQFLRNHRLLPYRHHQLIARLREQSLPFLTCLHVGAELMGVVASVSPYYLLPK